MTIRDPERFLAGLWDWGVFTGCFGKTRISPTDVDGLVEHNRHFLFLEAKPSKGSLTQGQGITLRNLSRQPNTTCVVFFGDPKEKTIERIIRMDNGVVSTVKDPPPSLETLKMLVTGWFAQADSDGWHS